MRHSLITLLLAVLFPSASFSSEWFDTAQQLNAENETQNKEAVEALAEEENLDKKIQQSLKNNVHVDKAMLVIKTLKIEKLFPDALEMVRKKPDAYALTSLMLMKDLDTQKILPVFIKELVTSQWKGLHPLVKFSVLEAAEELQITISPELLKSFLWESSDQLRMTATRLAGNFFMRTHDPDYALVVKISLASSPYQLRLVALNSIEEMSSRELKLTFVESLNGCLNDQNNEVKELCSAALMEQRK